MAPVYSSSPSSSPPPTRANIVTLTKSCFISHDSLKPIYAPFHYCEFCGKNSTGSYLLEGECYCEAGITKQKVTICSRCTNEYDMLSNYLPHLVTADRFDNAEDIIIAACEAAVVTAAESKSSIGSLDFYDTVREAYQENKDVQYYFNHDISNVNPEFRRLWRLRYSILKQYGL